VPAESGWWADTVGEHFKDLARAAPLLKTLHLTDEVAGWPVKRCSTGERARLALVRALAIDPAVLLLDEPTSALDEATTLAAEELVGSRIRQGMSVMWVTHDAAQARRVASRGLKILEGQVEEIALI
jgi:phosphate-transporting ATPase